MNILLDNYKYKDLPCFSRFFNSLNIVNYFLAIYEKKVLLFINCFKYFEYYESIF